MIDPNALAAAYVAAGYTVMPLGQFPAHRAGTLLCVGCTRLGALLTWRRAGIHGGMDVGMAYSHDPASYASYAPASSAPLASMQHGGGGYPAAQEQHRRTEMQF